MDLIGTIFDPAQIYARDLANAKKRVSEENQRRVAAIKDRWAQQYAANQRSVDGGNPPIYPKYDEVPKKLVIVETDAGITELETTFPDLVPPEIPKPGPVAVSGSLRSANAGPDPNVVTQAGISEALRQLAAVNQKVDALTALLREALGK